MKQNTLIIITLAICLLAGGLYFYFSGKQYTIALSESDLQQKLAEKLPLTKSYFYIIEVTIDNPRIHLKQGSNKVSAGFDVAFNIKLNSNPKPIGGTVDVSGGVRYVAKQSAFYLTEPVIEKLAIQGISPKYTDKANKALTKTLSDYYKKNPIYVLKDTDAKQNIAKKLLKDVLVENKQLLLKFGI